MIFTSTLISAIDDFRLVRMQRQSAISKPRLKSCPQRRGLVFCAAVANRIVGIALERDGGMIPRHPDVEGIMQEQVRQDRADHPTLWRSSLPDDEAALRRLRRCLQPSLDVHQHPRAVGVLAHRPHQQFRLDAVKEGLDIEIKNPVMTPASLPRREIGRAHV